jgi:hypothetical protein
VVKNGKNELIPQRTMTRWRMCIDYQKLNKATKTDHFPLPFIDVMLEILAKHTYFCFRDGYSVSYGPRLAHYLGGYQNRLLGGPLGLLGLGYTAPDGVEHKDLSGEVLG